VSPEAVECPSRDVADDAAAALGLFLVNIVPGTETYPAQAIYVTPDRGAQIHLVDAAGALSWVVRAGGDATVEARWSEALRAAMVETS
jgi:hypothetical protein